MATIHGKDGVLTFGSNGVAEANTWTIEVTNEAAEHSVIGRDWRDYTAGQSGFTVEIEGFYDTADAGQGDLVPGSTVSFTLQPGGNTSGEVEFTGDGIVTTVSHVNANDAMVTFSASLQGTGTLTTGTVV